jgi:hypothetical protein
MTLGILFALDIYRYRSVLKNGKSLPQTLRRYQEGILMKNYTLRLALLLGLLVAATSSRAEDTQEEGEKNICFSISSHIEKILEVVLTSEAPEVSTKEYYDNARESTFSRFDACSKDLKTKAEARIAKYTKYNNKFYLQMAKGDLEVAAGAESILNGLKKICIHRTNQASELAEFVCYLNMVKPVQEILKQ